MRDRIQKYLRRHLADKAWQIGQVAVSPQYSLNHADDHERADLVESRDPHEAIIIARYDDAGNYRPLKTAPNLKHGWRLVLRDAEEVLRALDFLYPAAIGTADLFEKGELLPVDLRRTLDRQTGMYAVTKKISDEQANNLAAAFCAPGCLRRILWDIAPGLPVESHPPPSTVPLLCAEACNLFVAKAREVVKGKPV